MSLVTKEKEREREREQVEGELWNGIGDKTYTSFNHCPLCLALFFRVDLHTCS